MSRSLLAVLVIGTLLRGGAASASPLEDPTLSGSDVFTGVTEPHASSIYLNPAAIGLAGIGWHLFLGGNLRVDRYDIARLRITDANGTESPVGAVTAQTMTPSGIVAGYLKSDRVAVGLAIETPMAERFIADQEALRYHTLGGYHYQFGIALAASIYTLNRLYVGFGLSFLAERMRLRFARDTALDQGTAGIDSPCPPNDDPCGIENDGAVERYNILVASGGFQSFDWTSPFSVFGTSNLALSLGAMYRVTDDWWIAASYQGPPGILSSVSIAGRVRVDRAPRDGGARLTGEAGIDYDLPHTFHLGGRGPILPDWDLVADARLQTHQSHDRIDVRMFGGELAEAGVPEWYPRYLGFTWTGRIQAGLERSERGPLRYGARLGWEKATLPTDRITPLHVAGMQLYLNLGGELRLGQSVVLGASYHFGWFPTLHPNSRVYNPLDRLDCVDQQYQLDTCAPAREGRALPLADGDYSRLQHILAVSLRYDVL